MPQKQMHYHPHTISDGGELNEKQMTNQKPQDIYSLQHSHVAPVWAKILH